MPALSVVIITLNEERNIGRCLQSVSGLADEVIVVDSFSTDRTAEICRAAGAKFIPRAWEGYSATKNFAASQSSHDWILSLDADEALSGPLRASLVKIKSGNTMPFGEFNRLTRYENHWVRHCGWYPDKKLRLYDRRFASWQGDLHEKLIATTPQPVMFLDGDLLHYSYYSRDEHMAQIRRFSEIGARQLYDQGQDAGLTKILLKNHFEIPEGVCH
jgi:glycosyltransferase involved in cell wall biosynthesis